MECQIHGTADDVTRAAMRRVQANLFSAVSQRGRASLGLKWGEDVAALVIAIVRFGGLPWDRLDVFMTEEDIDGEYLKGCVETALMHSAINCKTQVHSWSIKGDEDRETTSRRYQEILPSRFDLVLTDLDGVLGVSSGEFRLDNEVLRQARDVVVIALGEARKSSVSLARRVAAEAGGFGLWCLDEAAAEGLEPSERARILNRR